MGRVYTVLNSSSLSLFCFLLSLPAECGGGWMDWDALQEPLQSWIQWKGRHPIDIHDAVRIHTLVHVFWNINTMMCSSLVGWREVYHTWYGRLFLPGTFTCSRYVLENEKQYFLESQSNSSAYYDQAGTLAVESCIENTVEPELAVTWVKRSPLYCSQTRKS